MTDNQCGVTVLVEAPDGSWPRMCIDPRHPVGTVHHLRFRGVVIPFLPGTRQVSAGTEPGTDQPSLV